MNFERDMTMPFAELASLLQSAFAEGVIHAVKNGANAPHPLLGDSEREAFAWCADLIAKAGDPERIWITSR